MTRKSVVAATIVLAAVAIGLTVYFGQRPTPEQLVATGSKLVLEENCSDCETANEEGLREGIADLEEAERRGLVDDPGAVHALTRGYSTLLNRYIEPDSSEYEQVETKLKTTAKRLTVLVPDEPQALYEYASTLENEERIPILERIVEIDPEFAQAQQGLAALYFDRGDKESAIEHMKQAVRYSSEPEDFSYYVWLAQWLIAAGREDELDEFPEDLRNRYHPQ